MPLVVGRPGVFKVANFTESGSPLRFSSYLTLYVEGEPNKPIVFKHDFYISEVMKTAMNPLNFQFINKREGNRFFVGRTSQAGSAVGIGVLTGVSILAVVAGMNAAKNVTDPE